MSNFQEYVLGEHIESLSGFPFSSEMFSIEDGVPLIRIRDVTDNKTPDVFYQGEYSDLYLVENGDVLIGMDGDFHIVRWKGGKGVLNQRVLKIFEKPNSELDMNFVFYWLADFLPKLNAITAATTVKHLSVKDIANAVVKAPSKAAQTKIGEILLSIDNQIDATQALIDKYIAIKQGMMADLFSRGIDPETKALRPTFEEATELYHKTPLGMLPKGWEVVELQSVATVERGKFTHRPRDDKRCFGGEYPFIQTGDVAACVGNDLTQYKQTLSDFGRSVSKEFPAGTVAVTIAANIADTAILAMPMCFPDSVVGVVVDARLSSSRFVELCIRMSKAKLDALAPQSAQKNINLEDLRPLKIPFPSNAEQELFCEAYEAINDPINSFINEKKKLIAQKSGLMQDLLTGKVPVLV
jgi:type I restriction enzyme, S subunit